MIRVKAMLFLLILFVGFVLPLQVLKVTVQDVKADPKSVGQVVDYRYANWSMFWQKVNRHVMWDLEWSSDGITWTSVKSDLQIQRA